MRILVCSILSVTDIRKINLIETGLTLPRIESNGERLLLLRWTYEFHKPC